MYSIPSSGHHSNLDASKVHTRLSYWAYGPRDFRSGSALEWGWLCGGAWENENWRSAVDFDRKTSSRVSASISHPNREMTRENRKPKINRNSSPSARIRSGPLRFRLATSTFFKFYPSHRQSRSETHRRPNGCRCRINKRPRSFAKGSPRHSRITTTSRRIDSNPRHVPTRVSNGYDRRPSACIGFPQCSMGRTRENETVFVMSSDKRLWISIGRNKTTRRFALLYTLRYCVTRFDNVWNVFWHFLLQ